MYGIQSAIFLTGLLLIAWKDANERRIPNQLLVLLMILRIVFLSVEWSQWSFWIQGFLLGGGLLLTLYLLFPGGVGAGDVKLCAVIGFYLGSERLLNAIFFAASYALLCSMGVRILRKGAKQLPFGTFLFLSVMTVMLIYREGV